MPFQRCLDPRAMLALFVVVLGAPLAPAQTVQWRPDYGAARRESSERKQPLVLVFSAGYCGWCSQMEGTTFRDPNVIGELNRRFIPLKVAADDARNTYLVSGLRVQGLPAIVLVSPAGKVLLAQEGYLDSAGFLALLRRGLANADDPSPRPRASPGRTAVTAAPDHDRVPAARPR